MKIPTVILTICLINSTPYQLRIGVGIYRLSEIQSQIKILSANSLLIPVFRQGLVIRNISTGPVRNSKFASVQRSAGFRRGLFGSLNALPLAPTQFSRLLCFHLSYFSPHFSNSPCCNCGIKCPIQADGRIAECWLLALYYLFAPVSRTVTYRG